MGSAVFPTMFTGQLGVDVNIGCVGGTILSDGMIKRDDGGGRAEELEVGTSGRRWIRFRVVSLPLPSTLIRYCLYGNVSMTIPDLSQRLGGRPSQF